MPRTNDGLTLKAWLEQAAVNLKRTKVGRPHSEARYIAAIGLACSNEAILAEQDNLLSASQYRKLDALLERRLACEPLAYIRGFGEFYGRNFLVTKDVLIPRPATELLVDLALHRLKDGTRSLPLILDLGVGSGCVLLSILAEHRAAFGIGTDLSAGALQIARMNTEKLGLSHRMALVRGDWTDSIKGKIDIIVSNPPYIPRGSIDRLMRDVRDFEPRIALDGGTGGLDAYKRLASDLGNLLKPDGLALIEVGFDQAEQVCALLSAHGFETSSAADLTGIQRCVKVTQSRRPNASS